MNNSNVQGYFNFNDEKYSVNDLVTALLSQGITIHKVGTNLKVGQKIINPVVNNTMNYSQKSTEAINETVIQGLANQIQRIFSELNKLKDHLGVNNPIMKDFPTTDSQIFNFSSLEDKSTSPKNFSQKGKWDGFVSNKSFDLEPEKFEQKNSVFNTKNDTPIITLGRKKNASVIDEYNDLVTNKGFPDDDALDSLSTKLFNTATDSIYNVDKKQDLRAVLISQPNEKSPAAMTDYTTYMFTKCDQCNSKIPNEAQFCSKCGKKR